MRYGVLLLLSVVVTACSRSGASDVALGGTDEERAYDLMQRKGQWSEIVHKNQESPVQSLACQKVVLMAHVRQGMGGREAVYECLANSKDVLTSPLSALMMSDVYMQLGMVNMAQRAAFEALVKMPAKADNSRALRRLTETAIITKQYDLAIKYIGLLEKKSAHHDWASSMRQMIVHPTPEFEKFQRNYENTEDQFFL